MPDLDMLLTVAARFVRGDVTYVMEAHPLGHVVLPTGRVVACDPLVFSDGAAAFTVSVSPGRYPLRAWVALLLRGDELPQRRVAALQLAVVDQPVSRWEMALIDGDDLSTLSEDGFFGYPVDAGTGTLADIVAVRGIDSWDYDRIEEHYIPAQIPEAPVPGALTATTDEATGANIVVVSTGWGDGLYPTFVGYTADDQLACFVTDFMVVSPE
jgi:hypothetical protein